MTRVRLRAAGVLLGLGFLVGAVPGCGGTTERVERTVVTVVKTVPSKPATKTHKSSTKRHSDASRARSDASAFVACDPNISARRETTSCPFAENAFYEYWASGGATSVRAYSPSTRRTYRLRCSSGTMVRCTAGDGAEIRFPESAVSAYTDDQAQAYAASADLGPADSTGATSGPDTTGDSTSSDGGYGNEIPNYDNGRGYRVQCADGMYSKSGGIQGACSGHGGVGLTDRPLAPGLLVRLIADPGLLRPELEGGKRARHCGWAGDGRSNQSKMTTPCSASGVSARKYALCRTGMAQRSCGTVMAVPSSGPPRSSARRP